MQQRILLTKIVVISLFVAIIAIGGILSIPGFSGSVPIVLQNALIILTACVLGFKLATIAVICFLILGFLGLPFFSNGTGGMQSLFGPTAGFLFGYLAATIVTSLIIENKIFSFKNKKIQLFLAILFGLLAMFVCGIPYLKIYLKISWTKAFAIGFFPFVVGMIIKMLVLFLIIDKVKTKLLNVFPILKIENEHF